ncbi:MFS transporter [Streptomyces sp. NPDC050504]|uniref:MFS transporter n=1 Tax=Streptomyces sp. NPDC050504 TaxID=3365618 RepID=UPI00379BAA53
MDRAAVHRHRWKILAVLCISLVLISLDNLVLNLALPKIQLDLGATGAELQWTVDSYTLTFGGLLLLCGSLADRFGRRRLLLLGMALFGAFSLGAAFAGDTGTLIAMRAAMGVGAAMIMPATLAVIKDVFPADEQAKAVGIWAGTAAIGVPLGPVIGGLLLEYFWWGSVFLVNIPVVLLALWAGAALVPESRAPRHPGLDLVGALLSVAGLTVLVYGLVEAPRHGWTDATTLGLLLGGAALLAGFLFWERSTAHPLLTPGLFGDARFGGAAVAVLAIAFGMYSALFVLTQYLQFILAYEPLEAGLRLLAVATMVPAAPVGTLLARRVGLRAVIAGGLVLITAALVVMAGAGQASEGRVLLSLALFGLGAGLSMPTAADAMLAAAPRGQSGAGSAVTDTALQIGGALGIAGVGSVLTTSYRDALPPLDALPPQASDAVRDSLGAATAASDAVGGPAGAALAEAARRAFTDGLGDALTVGAVATALGAVAAALILPGRPGKPEDPGAAPGTDEDFRPGVSGADPHGSHQVKGARGGRHA